MSVRRVDHDERMRVPRPIPFARTTALCAALFLFWAVGPWALLAAVSLAVPRVRRWLRPTKRVLGLWVVGLASATAVVVLLPDGYLPIPPGAGALVTPSYIGHPAKAEPIDLTLPQNPRLASNGSSAMHNDGWSSDAYAGPGPLGRDPDVDSAWYGIKECATLAFNSVGDMVALCGNLRGAIMHVIDAATMRPEASLTLPARGDGHGKKPWENLCGGSYFYLDDDDNAVVETTDARIVTVSTHDDDGDPALAITASYDLGDQVDDDDCLIALMPDWLSDRTWWVTQDGVVGTVGPDSPAKRLDLGEEIANSFSVGEDGGAYVVTVDALYKLKAAADGTPRVIWRRTYDRGSEQKPGQLSQGSGTTPTVMPNGLVAITDNADPRMHVQFYRTDDGALVCEEPVFGDDASASDNSLVSVGTGMIVENNHGYGSPLRTILGRSTTGGFARVEIDYDPISRSGTCSTAWTNDVDGPSSVAKVSLATGLLYAYTKRSSWLGVNAWYLTAMSARTGRTAFAVRTGIGTLFNNHYSAVTLGPDGSAYAATLAGMVRVRDTG